MNNQIKKCDKHPLVLEKFLTSSGCKLCWGEEEFKKITENKARNRLKVMEDKIKLKELNRNKVKCSDCKILKQRFTVDPTKFKYEDEDKRLWLRRRCPDCALAYFKLKNNQKIVKVLYKKECRLCKTEFETFNNRQFLCSRKCRSKNYNRKLPKIKIPRLCKECNTQFEPKKHNCRICKPLVKQKKVRVKKPRIKKIRSNKGLYKKRTRKAKPKSVSWSKIAAYYEKCPKDKQVDHIIPLNHPHVCGLHYPVNFQYLSPEDNVLKSNKFDYTYDNLSWKKK